MNPGPDNQLQERLQRIEGLLQQIESFADPVARETAREVVQTLMDLHGAGLASILDKAHDIGPAGEEFIESLASDELVSSLLLLYGLHPDDLSRRVDRALKKVLPSVRAQGGDVELVSLSGDVVQVRLMNQGDPALRGLVEEALANAAPDATAIHIDEVQTGNSVPSRLVSLPLLGRV